MNELENNQELLTYFFEEAFQIIGTMENAILELERDKTKKDAINEIFRGAHTLKGSAASLDMNELAQFAHVFEDSLDFIRSNEGIDMTADTVDTILDGIDLLKQMIEARNGGEIFGGQTAETEEKIRNIPGLYKKNMAPKEQKKPEASLEIREISITDTEKTFIFSQKKPNEHVYAVYVFFSSEDPMASIGPLQVFSSLRDLGIILKTSPSVEDLNKSEFYEQVSYLFKTDRREDDIRKFIDIPEIVRAIKIAELDFTAVAASAASTAEIPTAPKTDSEGQKAENQAQKIEQIKASTILRVDSERIDELLNLVSQIVINKAALIEYTGGIISGVQNLENIRSESQQIIGALSAITGEKEDKVTITRNFANDVLNLFTQLVESTVILKEKSDSLSNELQVYSRTINLLQEGVMKIRMVPIDQMFTRFPRIIRDLSKKLGKDVELVMEGAETELDKSIIEELSDPLMHILRNCMDHGVETPQERRKSGKPEKGRVTIGAKNEGNIIFITVEDDGAGINIDRVRSKAVQKNLITDDQLLTSAEVYSLLFLPGFSTAEKISDVSGRGVGLDVVKKALERLNGNISVESRLGKGTKMTIKLPLTLAIIQALMVNISEEIYAIPINAIFETRRVKPDEILKVEDADALKIRDEIISIIFLNKVFKLDSSGERDFLYIVVVGVGDRKVGLVVDSLIGGQDIVIKPLNNVLTKVQGLAGSAILGNGDIALILDINQLVEFERVMTRHTEAMEEMA